jgi:CRISPR-associated protein Csb1
LRPVGDRVIFPPTYANPSQKKGDPPVYNIDRFAETVTLTKRFEKFEKAHTFMDLDRVQHGQEHSVCVIDSIPSQANRIEPVFGRLTDGSGRPVRLVPAAVVKAQVNGEAVQVDLLVDAGHRAADAVVRLSSKGNDLGKAFGARKRGDSTPLAKLAPTSLVFGTWDSRESGVKVPRLINSIIRAYDVLEHRRSSQFNPAMDFEGAGVVRETKDKKLSEVGMDGAPATFLPGGVEARGGVRREAAVNLCTLRDVAAKSRLMPASKLGELEYEDLTRDNMKAETEKLQRYLLGLVLVALTYFDGRTLNLRQGCQLVAVKDRPISRKLVYADGTEAEFDVDGDEVVAYATEAAAAFGVGPDWGEVEFDVKAARGVLRKTKNEQEQERQ